MLTCIFRFCLGIENHMKNGWNTAAQGAHGEGGSSGPCQLAEGKLGSGRCLAQSQLRLPWDSTRTVLTPGRRRQCRHLKDHQGGPGELRFRAEQARHRAPTHPMLEPVPGHTTSPRGSETHTPGTQRNKAREEAQQAPTGPSWLGHGPLCVL